MDTKRLDYWSFLEGHLKRPDKESLLAVMDDVFAACKAIAARLAQGDLEGHAQVAESINVQGEQQMELDIATHHIFYQHCLKSGQIAAMLSEEVAEILPTSQPNAPYIIAFDPLDGSSNVNLNISVGSLFSILLRQSEPVADVDFLQTGRKQVCAGYALYGTSTMIMLTFGNGLYGFTLNPEDGQFYMTHPSLIMPANSQQFAINMSHYHLWNPPIRQYVDACLSAATQGNQSTYNMRWVGSMVADMHRTLLNGGVFMYPVNAQNAPKNGKLRLLYEANPMAWLVEQAGGCASTGEVSILDVQPTAFHQRTPVLMGSQDEMRALLMYHANRTKL